MEKVAVIIVIDRVLPEARFSGMYSTRNYLKNGLLRRTFFLIFLPYWMIEVPLALTFSRKANTLTGEVANFSPILKRLYS